MLDNSEENISEYEDIINFIQNEKSTQTKYFQQRIGQEWAKKSHHTVKHTCSWVFWRVKGLLKI